MHACTDRLVGLPKAPAASLAALALLAVLAAGAAEAGQYDRYGRRIEPGAAPLVFGPLPGFPWRGRIDYGMTFPLGADTVVLRRGLGSAFRMVLPRAGAAGAVLDAVVENVEAENVADLVAGAPGAVRGTSIAYTGTLRGRPDVVVVLSVVNDVLYSRLAIGGEAWVIYSDAGGRVMVRVERLGAETSGGPGARPLPPGPSD